MICSTVAAVTQDHTIERYKQSRDSYDLRQHGCGTEPKRRKKRSSVMETADILKAVTNVADHEGHLLSEDMVIYKFLLVNPASIATDEKALSLARRVKTVTSVNEPAKV